MASGVLVEWIACQARFAPVSPAAYDLASGRRPTCVQFDERVTRATQRPGEAAVLE
jgi:hypothetical protein